MANKDEQKSTAGSTATAKRFSDMTGSEKLAHVSKVIVFFISFGFAFPNIFSD